MADIFKSIGQAVERPQTAPARDASSRIPDLSKAGEGSPSTAVKKKNEDVSKTEFLQILTAQLKSQDPLDPMKNDQFAVDLAQFSQLEQLISINEKVGGGADVASLAGYLGQEVLLSGDKVKLENGKGGSLRFTLEKEALNASVKLTNDDGKEVGTMELGPLPAGDHTIEIDAPNAGSGEFGFSVSATSPTAGVMQPKAGVVGTVSGFIPGPDPQLIVGGEEISPSRVARVNVPTVRQT